MTTPIIPNIHLDKDSLGAGEAVSSVANGATKLIDTISSAIGAVYEPTKIRRLADAKAYEQRVLADAKAYEIKTLALAKSEAEAQNNSALALTIEKASKRFVAQEVKRQLNLDYIVAKALEQIQIEKEVSDKPVDPDWTTRFINIAKDVSDSEMQDIWAQILAGEVASPGNYSYRTLECLKNLTKEEANMFIIASSLTMQIFNQNFIYSHSEILEKAGFTYIKWQRLVEAGLLNAESLTNLTIFKNRNKFLILYADKVAICKKTEKEYLIPIYDMTSVGEQLYKIVSKQYNEQYFIDVLKEIKKSIDSVEYSTVITIENGRISYTSPTTPI